MGWGAVLTATTGRDEPRGGVQRSIAAIRRYESSQARHSASSFSDGDEPGMCKSSPWSHVRAGPCFCHADRQPRHTGPQSAPCFLLLLLLFFGGGGGGGGGLFVGVICSRSCPAGDESRVE